MKQEVKEKWLAALRSGDFVQGRDFLRNDSNEFCCLGVLCDIAVTEGVIQPPTQGTPDDSWPGTYYYDGETQVLPAIVSEWAGMYDTNPDVHVITDHDEDIDMDLATLNDSGNYGFLDLADLIEEQL